MKKFSLLIAAFAAIVFAGCGSKRSQAYYEKPSQVLSATTTAVMSSAYKCAPKMR